MLMGYFSFSIKMSLNYHAVGAIADLESEVRKFANDVWNEVNEKHLNLNDSVDYIYNEYLKRSNLNVLKDVIREEIECYFSDTEEESSENADEIMNLAHATLKIKDRPIDMTDTLFDYNKSVRVFSELSPDEQNKLQEIYKLIGMPYNFDFSYIAIWKRHYHIYIHSSHFNHETVSIEFTKHEDFTWTVSVSIEHPC